MTLLANSYGSPENVAALVPRYGNSTGHFDHTTRPTLVQVETLMNQVSATLNSILATAGFDIPMTQSDAVLMLALWVDQETAALCEGINGSGRFGPMAGTNQDNRGRWVVIRQDAEEFVKENAVGLERLGASRTYDMLAGAAFRETNEAGDDTYPLFQRDGFGGWFTDWDPRG